MSNIIGFCFIGGLCLLGFFALAWLGKQTNGLLDQIKSILMGNSSM